ncbi:hypothetical protein I7I50_00295 [Histoplasma capsulatum G186AR]|uniref:Uncharacterized protein n=1 Tax=Ajellomyces capsulatus TaxID=5037 RepID=A0A8H7YG56_AJECA|nr:hypothetical protein I7I52_07563 [Histoplasma capsulatum]QSS72444.1 hypothetical protein I7I50_00295 [Histoplasma capsulatum G186AR]
MMRSVAVSGFEGASTFFFFVAAARAFFLDAAAKTFLGFEVTVPTLREADDRSDCVADAVIGNVDWFVVGGAGVVVDGFEDGDEF